MKILAFRITNFRSIIDSEWIPLSPDGITVFVGQNESGKTSVLEALDFALSHNNPTEDDCRIDAPLPMVRFNLDVSYSELPEVFEGEDFELEGDEGEAIESFLNTNGGRIDLAITWKPETDKSGKKTFKRICSLEAQTLEQSLAAISLHRTELELTAPNSEAPTVDVATPVAAIPATAEPANPTPAASPTPPDETPTKRDDLSLSILGEFLWSMTPLSVLFNEESGRLPNQVDIDEKGQPTGPGATAALNFLHIADLDLPELLKGDRRARENILNRANARVSEDFNTFWSQTIGKTGRLWLKCDVDHYSDSNKEKMGKAHLVFWICDGKTQLYPKQRSQGVRWFVSFYLQLKASEKNKLHRLFLLDEPGANLHSKAQGDVLKVVNKLGKDTSTVIYSTHSPQMLEYSKLFRVHAVQRDVEMDDSPTVVIDAHRLGTASTDTLSPVLSAMGADLSSHQVIRKTNNVLLEEMSGYYYLSSFWKLTKSTQEAHFIAATGVNKIEALANMFVGWGLEFVIAVDDDKQGREVYKSIKRELFGDIEELASKRLLKLPDCPGIEDAFSATDFKKHVLRDENAVLNGSNTEHLKTTGRSKPVLAFQFALAVEQDQVKWKDLEPSTKSKITAIVDGIGKMLAANTKT